MTSVFDNVLYKYIDLGFGEGRFLSALLSTYLFIPFHSFSASSQMFWFLIHVNCVTLTVLCHFDIRIDKAADMDLPHRPISNQGIEIKRMHSKFLHAQVQAVVNHGGVFVHQMPALISVQHAFVSSLLF